MLTIYAPEGGGLRFSHIINIPLKYRLSEIERIRSFMSDIHKLAIKKFTLHDFLLKNDAAYKAIHDKETGFIDDLKRLESGTLDIADFVKTYGTGSLPLIDETFNNEKITKIDFEGSPFELSFFQDIEILQGRTVAFGKYAANEPNTLSIAEYIEKYNYKDEIKTFYYENEYRVKEELLSIADFVEKYKNGRPIKISDHEMKKLDGYKSMIRDNGYLGVTDESEPQAILAEYEEVFMELQAFENITNDLLRVERIKEAIADIDEPTARVQYVMNECNAEGWNKSRNIASYLKIEFENLHKSCFIESDSEPNTEKRVKGINKKRVMLLLDLGILEALIAKGITDQVKQAIVIRELLGLVGSPSDTDTNIRNWKNEKNKAEIKEQNKIFFDRFIK